MELESVIDCTQSILRTFQWFGFNDLICFVENSQFHNLTSESPNMNVSSFRYRIVIAKSCTAIFKSTCSLCLSPCNVVCCCCLLLSMQRSQQHICLSNIINLSLPLHSSKSYPNIASISNSHNGKKLNRTS